MAKPRKQSGKHSGKQPVNKVGLDLSTAPIGPHSGIIPQKMPILKPLDPSGFDPSLNGAVHDVKAYHDWVGQRVGVNGTDDGTYWSHLQYYYKFGPKFGQANPYNLTQNQILALSQAINDCTWSDQDFDPKIINLENS